MPSSALRQPLEELGDVLQRFVRMPEVRMLCIEVQSSLHAAARQLVLASEHLADNTSPLLPIELARPDDDDATWEAATEQLRSVHGQRRDGGGPFAPLAERPMRSQGSANFAAQVLQCLGTVRAPAEGLIVAIDVRAREPASGWLSRLAETIRNPRLASARFVVLVAPATAIAPWIETFERGTVVHQSCVVDDARATRELEADVEAEEQLGPGFRGAWPKGVRPPPRPRAAGIHAVAKAAPDGAMQLRVDVKRAALALRKDDGPEAIRRQAAARDRCLEAGRIRDAITMELVLGAYMLRLGQHPLALGAFQRAATRATEAEHWDLAAQAYLSAASAHERAEDPTAALAAHRQGIAAAQKADDLGLAMQSYWQAGQIALALELEIDCIALWGDAFAYAQSVEPARLRGTRAKDITLELSRLLARYRRYSDAREVERAAAAFEARS